MIVLSTRSRTNDLLDAVIELAHRRYGWSIEHLAEMTFEGFTRRARKNTVRFGRVATLFEHVVHEIGHVIVQNRGTEPVEGVSDGDDFPNVVDEMTTAAFTGTFLATLDVPRWTWSARQSACSRPLRRIRGVRIPRNLDAACLTTLKTIAVTQDVRSWVRDLVAQTERIARYMPGYCPSLASFNECLQRLDE